MVNMHHRPSPTVGGRFGERDLDLVGVLDGLAQGFEGHAVGQVSGHGGENIPPVEHVADFGQPILGAVQVEEGGLFAALTAAPQESGAEAVIRPDEVVLA